MATIIDLANLGDRGFVMRGERNNDRAGAGVSSAGDINGDGFDDVIVGARRNNDGGRASGTAYVIYGKADGFERLYLGKLSPEEGFAIRGGKFDQVGASVSGIGDFNGDGLCDVIIGSYLRGDSYVVFGKEDGLGTIDLPSLTAADGFKMHADGWSRFSQGVSTAGDVNGDGYDDVIVGVPYGARGSGGKAYVVFGNAAGTGPADLAHLTPDEGFLIRGVPGYNYAGGSVASAGDINGDGFGDLIVGDINADKPGTYSVGAAYVVFGKADGFGTVDLADLTLADGFAIYGERQGDEAGFSVASAGDVNGDGFADVIVGAPQAYNDLYEVGNAYVVYGKAGGFDSVDLASLTRAEGFAIIGDRSLDIAGWSVASAGDVNGDGFADVVVGASLGDNGGKDVGNAYVIYGKAGGLGTIDLGELADDAGFVIQGESEFGGTGFSVASAGDVNGDGFDDVTVGAYRDPANGYNSGAAYVVFGEKPTEDVVRIGSVADQTIHGGFGNDTLKGAGGDDGLIGNEGDDRLEGQGGNDDLRGGDGTDNLLGGAGDDIMYGGVGDDRLSGSRGVDALYGGAGKDLLSGGAEADLFHFSKGGSSADYALADIITDFSQDEHDRIDLSDYDAIPKTKTFDAFRFIGNAAFSGEAGQLRYELGRKETLVTGDTDGDRVADFTIRIDTLFKLTFADFVLRPADAPLEGRHLFLSHPDWTANPLLHLA